MKDQLQAIATIFSLINPVMCATMFIQIEKDRDRRGQIIDATKAVLTILVVLVLAALIGAQILNIFGVSLDAFSVAGGAVLAWIGFVMLAGHGSISSPNPKPATDSLSSSTSAAPSLAPLILFAASPGTITGVITISASHTGLKAPVSALVAIVLVLAVTWVILILTARFSVKQTGTSVARDMVTRYMGLIVIAMGIQFALTGIKAFFHVG